VLTYCVSIYIKLGEWSAWKYESLHGPPHPNISRLKNVYGNYPAPTDTTVYSFPMLARKSNMNAAQENPEKDVAGLDI
jgi:hypothetical protein